MIDTQIIVWLGIGRQIPSKAASEALLSGEHDLLVSAVVAYEYEELNRRRRFLADIPLAGILEAFDAVVIDYPGDAWKIAARLPAIHRDPIDRMLVAHARHADLPVVSADKNIRRYPVATIW